MKNTGWLVVVWTVMVLGAIFWGDALKRWKVEEKNVEEGNDSVGISVLKRICGNSKENKCTSDEYNPKHAFCLPLPSKHIEEFERYERDVWDEKKQIEYHLLVDYPKEMI